jgi:rfaE bifunctional protein kinase chain/domain
LLVGLVGEDLDGVAIADHCGDAGIAPRLVRSASRPTTKKTRIIAHQQQVVRVDHEQTKELGQEEYEALFAILEEELPRHRTVILSDYGKGLVSKSFMDRFLDCVSRCPERPMILVDPKTRNFDLYIGVDILTPNRKEASEGAHLPVGDQKQIMAAGGAIMNRLGSKHLLITLGADGMVFFDTANGAYHIPTMARTVFDVTGAGDTVIATMGLALSAGASMLEACVLANHAAGIVVGQIGAATASRAELAATAAAGPTPKITRW